MYSLTKVMKLWIHLCSRLEMKDHLHQESYARSCRETEELKNAAIRKNYWKTTKIGRISYAAWSGITNSESILLRSWLLSSCDGPTFLIKLLSHRVQESLAAKLECREIHERICVFLETFLIVNLLERSWWIVQLFKKFGNTIGNRWWCQGFWEKKELRLVGAKNHCNRYLYLAFQ